MYNDISHHKTALVLDKMWLNDSLGEQHHRGFSSIGCIPASDCFNKNRLGCANAKHKSFIGMLHLFESSSIAQFKEVNSFLELSLIYLYNAPA